MSESAQARRPEGWLNVREYAGRLIVKAGGQWNLHTVQRIERELGRLSASKDKRVTIDLGAVEIMDTAGA